MLKKFVKWVMSFFKKRGPITLDLKTIENSARVSMDDKGKVTLEKWKETYRNRKIKAVVYGLVRVCPGKRHAWFDSSVGLIRKQVIIGVDK